MNPEIARLAHEFKRQKLTLPPAPLPNFPADGDGSTTTWPAELPIHFLSIREAREKAFLGRLTPSAAAVAHVFHGVRGTGTTRNSRNPRNRPRRRGKFFAPSPSGPLRPGEIGCDASHRKLWQALAGADAAAGAVNAYILCEDDVNLRGDPAQVNYLRVLLSEAAALQLDLVYLSWYQGFRGITGPPRQLSAHLRAPFGEYLQLWCIYVTRAGLEKLVREFPVGAAHPTIPIDVAVRRSRLLRAAVAWPPLTWTTGAASDTAPAPNYHITRRRR